MVYLVSGDFYMFLLKKKRLGKNLLFLITFQDIWKIEK